MSENDAKKRSPTETEDTQDQWRRLGGGLAQLPNLEKLFVTDSSDDIGVSTMELHLQVKVFAKDDPRIQSFQPDIILTSPSSFPDTLRTRSQIFNVL